MTTNEQPSPDQTGTWEPDYEAILDCYWGQSGRPELDWINEGAMEGLQAVIAEYRSQQAAQGIVEVRREDAAWAIRVIERRTTNDIWDLLLADESYQRLLAAAKDQDR